MTRRQAKIEALRIAWKLVERDIASSFWDERSYEEMTMQDRERITKELDDIAQSLFNRMKGMEERTKQPAAPSPGAEGRG